MLYGYKGVLGDKIEKKIKSKKCIKCKRVFIETSGTKCPFCGSMLKDSKIIIWN